MAFGRQLEWHKHISDFTRQFKFYNYFPTENIFVKDLLNVSPMYSLFLNLFKATSAASQ